MKYFTTTILLAAAVFTHDMKAQYAWDIGGNLGFANYLGDIGGDAGEARDWILDLKLSQTRWNSGVFARYRIGYNWGLNLSINYARLQGADSIVANPNRFTRNLHFRNDIFELAGNVEYYFFSQPDVGLTGRYLLDFRAFVSAGFGAFYNNPKAKHKGNWLSLRPLKTEAQETPYNAIQAAIPIGFGFYYTFSRVHRFGMIAGWRLTFTDYIDDVSGIYPDPDDLESEEAVALSNRSHEVADNPLSGDLAQFFVEGGIRGNPDANDSYLTLSATYSYVIRGSSRSFGRRRNYLYGRKRSRTGRARF